MAEASKRGQKIFLTEGPGKGKARVDYIRKEFKKGRKRGEIAKELGVAYQIVFAATKEPKPKEGEKAGAKPPVAAA